MMFALSEFRGHAMAEIQGPWLRRVWLVARTPFLHPTIQAILPYLSSGYEPGSQGIFIEEAFYCILYSYDRLPRATTSLPPAKVGTTKCNVASLHQRTIHPQPSTSYQMLLDTAQLLMIILCS